MLAKTTIALVFGALCVASMASCDDIKDQVVAAIANLNSIYPNAKAELRASIAEGHEELQHVLDAAEGKLQCSFERQQALESARYRLKGFGKSLYNKHADYCSAVQNYGGESDYERQAALVAQIAKTYLESPAKELTPVEIEASNAILERKDQISAEEAAQLLTDSSRPAFTNELALVLLEKVAAAQEGREAREDWDFALGSCRPLYLIADAQPGSCNDMRMRLFAFKFDFYNKQQYPVTRYVQEVAHNHFMECKKVGQFV